MVLPFVRDRFSGPHHRPNQRGYASLAAGIFFAIALFELARIALDLPWRNVPRGVSFAVGASLALLWTAAALALLGRGRKPSLLTLSWFLAIAGTLACGLHGAVTRVFGSMPGLFYLVIAIVQAVLIKSSFDRGFLQTGIDAGTPARSF